LVTVDADFLVLFIYLQFTYASIPNLNEVGICVGSSYVSLNGQSLIRVKKDG